MTGLYRTRVKPLMSTGPDGHEASTSGHSPNEPLASGGKLLKKFDQNFLLPFGRLLPEPATGKVKLFIHKTLDYSSKFNYKSIL